MKIYYNYYRVPEDFKRRKGRPAILVPFKRGQETWTPASRGGAVDCAIHDDNNRIVAQGKSTCSMADNFNYRIGRDIARGRAEKEAAVTNLR